MADVIGNVKLSPEELQELGKKQMEKFLIRNQIRDEIRTQDMWRKKDLSQMTELEIEVLLESEGLGFNLPNEENVLQKGLPVGGESDNPEDIIIEKELEETDFSTDEPPATSTDRIEAVKQDSGVNTKDKNELWEQLWSSKDTEVKLVIGKDYSLEKGKLIFVGNGDLDGVRGEIPIEKIIEALPSDKKQWFRDQSDCSIDFSKPEDAIARLKNRIRNLYLGKEENKKFIGSKNIEISLPERILEFNIKEVNKKLAITAENYGKDDDLKRLYEFKRDWRNGKIKSISLVTDTNRFVEVRMTTKDDHETRLPWDVFRYAYGLIKNVANSNGSGVERVRFPDEDYIFGPDTPEKELEWVFRSLVIEGSKLPQEAVFKKEIPKK